MSLADWKKEFEDKSIVIWGFGREGKESLKFIRSLLPEKEITIADSRPPLDLDDPYVRTVSDKACDFSKYDLILKAPGIVVPEGFDTSHISGETQLFLRHYRHQTIGVTGTKGKSTTTSLIYHLLKGSYKIHLIGNIGVPCFDVIEDMENGDLAAFEMSCHQLEFCPYSPHTAVFLNLFEEHLDHYGTFAAYGRAKANIVIHQEPGDTAIMNEDLTQYMSACQGKILKIGSDIDARGKDLIVEGHVLPIHDCALIGEHNYRNLAVAYAVARLYGVSDEEVQAAAASFEPLHHRLEDLGEFGGIRFVNDSISTIGQASISALKALPDTDVILIGGMDRGISYRELEDYLYARKDLQVIFMYAAGQRILSELKEKNMVRDGYHEAENLEDAVKLGRTLTRPHHICLLSPGASSYDHFKNFEERGDAFRKYASMHA